MSVINEVRQAKDRLAAAKSRAKEWQKPKLDAKIAILNADIVDRRTGLTAEITESVGYTIAQAVNIISARATHRRS